LIGQGNRLTRDFGKNPLSASSMHAGKVNEDGLVMDRKNGTKYVPKSV